MFDGVRDGVAAEGRKAKADRRKDFSNAAKSSLSVPATLADLKTRLRTNGRLVWFIAKARDVMDCCRMPVTTNVDFESPLVSTGQRMDHCVDSAYDLDTFLP